MGKKEKTKNPVDSFRKQQRKKELDKHKEARQKSKQTQLAKENPSKLEEEFFRLELLERCGKELTEQQRIRKNQIKQTFKSVLNRKMDIDYKKMEQMVKSIKSSEQSLAESNNPLQSSQKAIQDQQYQEQYALYIQQLQNQQDQLVDKDDGEGEIIVDGIPLPKGPRPYYNSSLYRYQYLKYYQSMGYDVNSLTTSYSAQQQQQQQQEQEQVQIKVEIKQQEGESQKNTVTAKQRGSESIDILDTSDHQNIHNDKSVEISRNEIYKIDNQNNHGNDDDNDDEIPATGPLENYDQSYQNNDDDDDEIPATGPLEDYDQSYQGYKLEKEEPIKKAKLLSSSSSTLSKRLMASEIDDISLEPLKKKAKKPIFAPRSVLSSSAQKKKKNI